MTFLMRVYKHDSHNSIMELKSLLYQMVNVIFYHFCRRV